MKSKSLALLAVATFGIAGSAQAAVTWECRKTLKTVATDTAPSKDAGIVNFRVLTTRAGKTIVQLNYRDTSNTLVTKDVPANVHPDSAADIYYFGKDDSSQLVINGSDSGRIVDGMATITDQEIIKSLIASNPVSTEVKVPSSVQSVGVNAELAIKSLSFESLPCVRGQ